MFGGICGVLCFEVLAGKVLLGWLFDLVVTWYLFLVVSYLLPDLFADVCVE